MCITEFSTFDVFTVSFIVNVVIKDKKTFMFEVEQ